jgi:hypothetical protein
MTGDKKETRVEPKKYCKNMQMLTNFFSPLLWHMHQMTIFRFLSLPRQRLTDKFAVITFHAHSFKFSVKWQRELRKNRPKIMQI